MRNTLLRTTSLLLLIFMATQSGAKVYYTRSATGNWNASSSWSTVTYGNATNTGTIPGVNDTALIGDAHTIMINTTLSVCSVSVGQGTSGILQYSNGGTYTMTVTNNVSILSGGKFWYNNNSGRTHTLNVGGDISNSGTVDFYYDSNDKVNITFNTAKNSTVSGGGTWDLNTVTMSKSTLSTYTLNVQSTTFESGIISLVTTQGTYIHNNSSSYFINSASASNFTISSNVVFKVPQGSLTFSPNTATLNLQGSLDLSGGNIYVGTTAGTGGIKYKSSGGISPYLKVTSGLLTVYGGINNAGSSDEFVFFMSGGKILLQCGSTGTSEELFFVNDKNASSFTMSGGTIELQKHNLAGGDKLDFGICGNNINVDVTGGVVQFGNASTPNGTSFDFKPFAGVVQPHFVITGAASSGNKLMTSDGSNADFKLLSLYITAGTTFDIRSISGSNGDSKEMTLTSTYDGTTAFYNDGTFTSRTGKVIIGGTSQQTISGSTATSFYDLTISNSSGVVLAKPATVTDFLSLLSGKLTTTSTNIITLTSSANSDLGTATSYVDGPMSQDVAQSTPRIINFPIGDGSAARPIIFTPTHSNATTATYRAEVDNSSAAALPYTLPGTLTRVSAVRYWNLSRSGASNFSSATIRLYYGADDGVTDFASLRVAQGVTSAWVDKGGIGTANGSGYITSGAITTFTNAFTLGNNTGGANPLPIELVKFTAEKNNEAVELKWTTASETNNDYFSVERSTDGERYVEIARLKGSGNTSFSKSYSSFDHQPAIGINYYRLKQTDFNGRFTYSSIVNVTFEKKQVMYLSPNPFRQEYLDVHMNIAAHTLLKVNICDFKGTSVYQNEIMVEKNSNQIRLENLRMGTNGIFIVRIDDGNTLYRDKLVVLRNQTD